MEGIALLFGILALWFVLMRWILPWLGISTCMCGCRAPRPHQTVRDDAPQQPDSDACH